MVDAVQSGSYGVLGLYGGQAVTAALPDPAVARQSEASTAKQVAGQTSPVAAPVVEAAQALGGPPLAASEAGSGNGQTGGRNYAGEGQAQARQTAVAASLVAAGGPSAGETASQISTAQGGGTGSTGAMTGRAAGRYARTAQATSRSAVGAMLTLRA